MDQPRVEDGLGSQIKAARERLHMTQTDLAKRLGVRSETIGNWERGLRTPKSRMGALREVLQMGAHAEPEPGTEPEGRRDDGAEDHRGRESDIRSRPTDDLWGQFDECVAELLSLGAELKRRDRAARRGALPPHGTEMPLPDEARSAAERRIR